jgi:hypothetical protein
MKIKKKKKIEIDDKTNYKRQNSKFNNIVTTTNTYNTFTNFRDSIINKVNINKSNEKEKEEENLVNINIEDSSSNDVENDKNKEKENEKSLKNSKKINNNEEKKRILKMYKTSMNEFVCLFTINLVPSVFSDMKSVVIFEFTKSLRVLSSDSDKTRWIF